MAPAKSTPRFRVRSGAMKDAELKTLRAARDALGDDDLRKAKRLLRRCVGDAPEGIQLFAAIDALAALEALEGDVGALFATADACARAYWDSPGPYRPHAITVRVLARLAYADWLAAHGGVDRLELAHQTVAEAKAMSRFGPVVGIEVVEKRVAAAVRKRIKTPRPKARKLRPRAKGASRKVEELEPRNDRYQGARRPRQASEAIGAHGDGAFDGRLRRRCVHLGWRSRRGRRLSYCRRGRDLPGRARRSRCLGTLRCIRRALLRYCHGLSARGRRDHRERARCARGCTRVGHGLRRLQRWRRSHTWRPARPTLRAE